MTSAKDNAEACYKHGMAAMEAGQIEQACSSFHACLLCEPTAWPAHVAMGNALSKARRFEAAIAHARIALSFQPEHHELHCNLGNTLWRAGHFEEARLELERASKLAPNHAGTWHNRGLLHYSMNQLVESRRCYTRALQLEPGNTSCAADASYPILASGDLLGGLRAHEARWASGLMKHKVWGAGVPRWDGSQDLSGKTLFVAWEQGQGDTLQFCRFVALIAERLQAVGGRVMFSVQASLVRLMQMSLPGVQVVGSFATAAPTGHGAVVSDEPLPDGIDYFCPLMALPMAMGLTYRDLPSFQLARPRTDISLQDPRLRIGLIWAGNPGFESDLTRSMPFQLLLPLADKGVALYSLQVGPRNADVANAGAGALVQDLTPAMTDFCASAEIFSQMDLVVSVDSAPLHLAAGLGVPTIALLPHLRCWRWLRDRDDSPWYPSLRIVQQKTPGDWAGAVSRVKKLITSQALRRAA